MGAKEIDDLEKQGTREVGKMGVQDEVRAVPGDVTLGDERAVCAVVVEEGEGRIHEEKMAEENGHVVAVERVEEASSMDVEDRDGRGEGDVNHRHEHHEQEIGEPASAAENGDSVTGLDVVHDAAAATENGGTVGEDGENASPAAEKSDNVGGCGYDEEEVRRAAALLLRAVPELLRGCDRCTEILQRLSGCNPASPATQSTSIVQRGDSDELAEIDSEATREATASSVSDQIDASATTGKVSSRTTRLWSEELSSSSEIDEEPPPMRETELPSVSARRPRSRVPAAAVKESASKLAFHSGKYEFAWAHLSLQSPSQGDIGDARDGHHSQTEGSSADAESPALVNSSLHRQNGNSNQVDNKKKLSVRERENMRFLSVKRTKNFSCLDRVRGKLVNVAAGLELHEKMFSKKEQDRLVDLVYDFQRKGREGLLRERTYTAPTRWMRGKGRVTIQFGCCYNYALDKNGNPPGIIRDELVDPLPELLKASIRRLVKWHAIPEHCVPNSCIVNIYDEGDCIPPHIDHHDFVRPFCTLSLLSECNILFGANLSILGPGEFHGPMSIPLPVGSVLVLQGNGADVAKHAVPAVPTRRISITFRKMDPLRAPRGYELPEDLKGVKALPNSVS